MDLIIQNSSDKRMWVLSGLTNVSPSERYVQFEDVEMPEDAAEGEYYYALICNDRDDVTYTLKTDVLETLIHTDDGDVILKDLKPLTGILRVGDVKEKNIYAEKKNKVYYYKKDGRAED